MARFEKLEFEQDDEHRHGENRVRKVTDAQTWMKRADEFRRSGAYEGSLQFYSRALEEDKTLISCWVGQVQMLIQLEEYPEAELWSRKALELFPGNGELLAARAQALCRTLDAKVSQAAIDQAMQQEGDSAYRWMVRGELLLSRRQSTHKHCFDRAMQCDNDWLTPVEAAMIYRFYQQPSNGLAYARLGTERNPTAHFAWYIVARCQFDLGMGSAAKRSLDACLDLQPDFRDAQNLMSSTASQSMLWKSLRRLWSK